MKEDIYARLVKKIPGFTFTVYFKYALIYKCFLYLKVFFTVMFIQKTNWFQTVTMQIIHLTCIQLKGARSRYFR